MTPAPVRPGEFCRYIVGGEFCQALPVGRCAGCSEVVCEVHVPKHYVVKRFAEAVE